MNEADIKEVIDGLEGKKVIIAPFFGEFGWELQRFQAHLRFLKHNVYTEWDFVLMIRPHMHIFYDDFISYSIDFPDWFYNLNLDCDGYEAVLPDSPPGSLTPPDVYQNIVLLLKGLCEKCEEYELLLPPRGCNLIMDTRPQIFHKFDLGKKLNTDKPIIVVFPRKRARASNRNIPEFVWREVVNILKKTFYVVLAGTPSGACLGDIKEDGIINLINYNELDKTELTIIYLNNAICSVSSQSGGTHISLLSGCPSYIIGHEKDRHAVRENRLNVPTSFRVLQDYRAIDSATIVRDLQAFVNALIKSDWFNKINRPSLRTLDNKKDLVGAEIGVGLGENALNILENLDIKKLYLIDPYIINDYIKAIGGKPFKKGQEKQVKEVVAERLEKHNDKIEWIYDLSENAVDKIKEELDFVYIDGDHHYEYIKKDVELYHPKVKEGGLVAGHDAENEDIKKVIKEFYGDGINYDESDWWVVKPTNTNKILAQDYEKLMELIQ